MAADSPMSLDMRECSRHSRPSSRRPSRLSGRGSTTCTLPRPGNASDGMSALMGKPVRVNPFAGNSGISQPNPFLAMLVSEGMTHLDAMSEEVTRCVSPSRPSLEGSTSRTTSSVSTPASPRFLHPHYNSGSAFAGSGGLDPMPSAGPSKRRRSIQVDGRDHVASSCSDFSPSSSGSAAASGSCGLSSSSASPLPFAPFWQAEGEEPITPAAGSLPSISVTTLDAGGAGGESLGAKQDCGSAGSGGASLSKEEKKSSPIVYIDSGCYSPCYHTSMTAPPPALSLATLPTHSLDGDREARRRRKACMSVLRSVQSSLQSSLQSSPDNSPHLGPRPEPQGASSLQTSATAAPPPPPAVRQPFFPSVFQSPAPSAAASASLTPSWGKARVRGAGVVSTGAPRRSSDGDVQQRRSDGEMEDASAMPSLCHPGTAGARDASTPFAPSPASQTLSPLHVRLRPEWFSPCTLATLIGASVHAYDEIRAAYPPPEPPPRTCVISLPAFYSQLPPHLLKGAVLLDAEAPALGTSSSLYAIECSQCLVGKSGGEGGWCGAGHGQATLQSANAASGEGTAAGSDRRPHLPAHLHGEFDIIICETRTVTVAALDAIAACIRALCRQRVPPIGAASGTGGQAWGSVDAAAEALSGLSLVGAGSAKSCKDASSCLPCSARVIMLSTCLLAPVVEDLLGLRQCAFQPYIPSSALSSLQLQCIYSNFTTFPGLQRHNNVDFSTRVRVKSSSRAAPSGGASRDSSRQRSRSGDIPRAQGFGGEQVLGSDAMIARALVLQSEEELQASLRGQESGTLALYDDSTEAQSLEARQESERQEARLLSTFNDLHLQGSPMAEATASRLAASNGQRTMAETGAYASLGFAANSILPPSLQKAQQARDGTTQAQTDHSSAGHGKACRGITMRSADDPGDDEIDYELECGSHFGMIAHEI
ncbi:hypothetical protein BESB_013010 [Besnoitia besnoiti]|uniref:Uncharacterized protein n=1 Tax=Besnoitia besnoiti TaxID=94643 RepID=A0A2A9M412_BESBE|nr:hypothetical protein BESB_013010 [Besnoitia besnoiti]PFH32689.1 hypothetical protein BESB_013010 [Besnoitia besnoiti]